MAWRMLAAMPEGKAIMLGLAGGFGITTGRFFLFFLRAVVVVVVVVVIILWFPCVPLALACTPIKRAQVRNPIALGFQLMARRLWLLFYCGLYVELWLYAASTFLFFFSSRDNAS